MKKIISIILAALLLCGTTALAVTDLFSMETDQSGGQLTVTVVLNEELYAGDATMLQGELYYDPDALIPVSVTASADYSFLTCVISQREPRVQFNALSSDSLPLELPAGTVVTVIFDVIGSDPDALRLEMDLQSADGTVVADLTEYASVLTCTEHDWDGLRCTICGAQRENPFTDTSVTAFYFKPMLWAVDQGIVNGTTPTTFSPGADLQRAQVVVMLWRLAGEPEPESLVNPFTDVDPARYYYKAVLWAVEEGITTGMSDTTFCPRDATTRAQAVTFLWRYFGKPDAGQENPFTDVKATAWYGKAVLWAVSEGITQGMTPTTFGVSVNSSRGHMVTFLYRVMN